MREPIPEEKWHLDKRVNLALVVAILLQTGGVVWWVAGQNVRMQSLSLAVERLDRQVDTNRNVLQLQAVQSGRIEEQIVGLREDVTSLILTIQRRQPNRDDP